MVSAAVPLHRPISAVRPSKFVSRTGIDIDWEYPGFPDHSGTPQDRDNFKLLLDDVRAKLDELGRQTGRFYGLTAALPCGPRHLANLDIAHVASTLSELNLMRYGTFCTHLCTLITAQSYCASLLHSSSQDFHGAFSATTGINAPLYHQGWGEEDFDVHSCVENWLAGGGSRDKISECRSIAALLCAGVPKLSRFHFPFITISRHWTAILWKEFRRSNWSERTSQRSGSRSLGHRRW